MKGALGKESTQPEGLRATIIGGSDQRLWAMSLQERLRRDRHQPERGDLG